MPKRNINSIINGLLKRLGEELGSNLNDTLALLLKLSAEELYETGLIEKQFYQYIKEL